eukprot:Platyproteum_vivax@DN7562_c0_g1_i7.p1
MREDPDLATMFHEELTSLFPKWHLAHEQFSVQLQEYSESSDTGVRLQVSPTKKGQDTSLVAADLFRMYELVSAHRNWDYRVVSHCNADTKGRGMCSRMSVSGGWSSVGIREATAEIKGPMAWNILKNEGGQHKVIRFSPIQRGSFPPYTSLVSVTVTPFSYFNVDISKKDDVICTYQKTRKPGGTSANKSKSQVTLEHPETGCKVVLDTCPNAYINKLQALGILIKKIVSKKANDKIAATTKLVDEQMASRCPADRIRTYNVLTNEVVDHRLQVSAQTDEVVLDGNLDPFFDGFL